MLRLIFWLILIMPETLIATIDMNLSEFQYLANHLQEEECRKLIALLHFKSYAPPNDLKEAELRVSKDIPCFEQLLHWNKEGNQGKSETHEVVARRLRQIGRSDLANWLAKTSYNALGKDFDRLIQESFKSYQPIHLPAVNLTTSRTTLARIDNVTHKRIAKQDFVPSETDVVSSDPTEWTVFDTISWTIVFVLFIIIIALTIYLTLSSPCCKKKKRRRRRYDSLHDEDDSAYLSSERRAACGLKDCPKDTLVEVKCPNADSKNDNNAALDLMGVEAPQSRSPTPRPKHSNPKSVTGKSSVHRISHRHIYHPSVQTYHHQPPPPPNTQVVPANATQGQGMRTIDIHQKIAIPMGNNSS